MLSVPDRLRESIFENSKNELGAKIFRQTIRRKIFKRDFTSQIPGTAISGVCFVSD